MIFMGGGGANFFYVYAHFIIILRYLNKKPTTQTSMTV